MKKLIFITWPMGIGKTLADTLWRTAFIDGDWCLDIIFLLAIFYGKIRLQHNLEWFNVWKVSNQQPSNINNKVYTTFIFNDIESIENCNIIMDEVSFYISDKKTYTPSLK